MSASRLRSWTWVGILFLVIACLESGHSLVSGEGKSTNLISNASFESRNEPSNQGWVVDSSLTSFVEDSPPNGGRWAIKLEAGWAPLEGFAETYISGQSGKGIYRLSVWMKSINHTQGTLALGLQSQRERSLRKEVSNDSAQWTPISLMDTLSLQPTDSIIVRLSAGITEVVKREVLFDLVEFEKITSRKRR